METGVWGAGSREERGGGSQEATEVKSSPGHRGVGGERAGEGLLGATSLLSPPAEAALWFWSQWGGREAGKDIRGAEQAPGVRTLSSDHPLPQSFVHLLPHLEAAPTRCRQS